MADFNISVYLIGPKIPTSTQPIIKQNPQTTSTCRNRFCSCRHAILPDVDPLSLTGLTQNEPWMLGEINVDEDLPCPFKTFTSIQFYRGYYHECDLGIEKPDLVLCSNAGLEVYDSWIPTMNRIVREGSFAMITDYTEEAIYRSVQLCKRFNFLCDYAFVNPFRSPIPYDKTGIDVPSFSNGFGFILKGSSKI